RKLLLKVQKERDFVIDVVFRVDLLKRLIFGTSRNHLCIGGRDQPPDKDNTQRHYDSCLHLVLLSDTPQSEWVPLYQNCYPSRQVFWSAHLSGENAQLFVGQGYLLDSDNECRRAHALLRHPAVVDFPNFPVGGNHSF